MDKMNIYVGNLSYSSTEESIRANFAQFGEVSAVRIIQDRETGRSRGFGFVEMPNDEEARAAIAALDGKDVDGRPIKLNEAQPRPERRGGPGGGGGGGDRGGDRGGGGGGGRGRDRR